MKRRDRLVNLGSVGLLWFCLAFSCSKEPTSRPTTGGSATASSRETNADIPELPGTDWALLSMTKKGDAVKNYDTPSNVDFCKGGNWTIYHYGGRLEAGSYQVRGNRLAMEADEVGTFSGAYTMTLDGDILTLDDGEYVLRLRADGKVNC